jgi:hypothetical protein
MADLIFDSSLYGDVAAIPYPIQTGATEALEFYTDVLPSFTDEAEERSQLRALPRHSFEYAHALSLGYMQEIANALRANVRGRWLIPQWFEMQPVALAGGETTLEVDTTIHDLRADSHALIFKSLCDWQIVTVTSIEADSITFEPACAFAGRAYVVPFIVGKITGLPSAKPSGFSNEFSIRYLADTALAGLTETPTQFNSQDLYTEPYLIQGRGDVRILQDESQLEFSVGGIDLSTVAPFSRYSKEYRFEGQGAAEMRAFKNYVYRRAGRFRPFYSPSFESNLTNLSTGTVVSTFKFKDEGYTDRLFPKINRIGFKLANGTWEIRTATASAHIGGGEDQITLDTPLNVPASSIELVSFVALNRLDTDRIEISLGQNQSFKSSASVLEIPE